MAADLVLPVRQQAEPQAPPRPAPAPAAAAGGTAKQSQRRLVPTELGNAWYVLAQALCSQGGITALARELLLQSQLMQGPDAMNEAAASDATASHADATPAPWVVRVEQESLNHEPSRKKLEQALAAHTGQPVRLQIEYGRVVDCPALRQAALRAQKQQAAEQAFAAHPFVQAMIAQFGARILPGSVGHTKLPPTTPAATSTSPSA